MIPVLEAQCVVAVAQDGSFRKAATRLYLSQPAVSTYVDRLEHRIGVTVFSRTRSGSELTPEGAQVLPHLEALIAKHEEVERVCRAMADQTTPKLSIASQRIGLVSLLPPVLRVLRGIVPEVRVDTMQATDQRLIDLVASGEADVGLGYRASDGAPLDPALEVVSIATTPSVVFMAPDHRLADKRSLEPADLSGETLITLHSALAQHDTEEWLGHDESVSWVRADDMQVVLAMVHEGVGVAVSIAAAGVLGPPSLVKVPVRGAGTYDLTLVRRRDAEMATPAAVLWEMLTPAAPAAAA